ncbi:hypothetical protein L486_04114 [Kwoniella mangroviensis CBS 10435]|uniref:Uncharacterized protein n=1 Tax=Kwoniella mangroviensis CBS 10435 TaxID=1331196 RepID=A0A1B9IRA9_9TREE|nr:hypothetical protein L486_04114 [Kwoniella mangroviensis CBS 10435]
MVDHDGIHTIAISTNQYIKPKTVEDIIPPLQKFTKRDLLEIFGQPQKRTLNCYTNLSSESLYRAPLSHPLNDLVCYITIPSDDGQPEWNTKNVLWADGSAEKLIKDYELKESKNFYRTIPVFVMDSDKFGKYTFIGWWKYTSLKVIEPFSDELMEMMKLKESTGAYSKYGKSEKKWKKSCSGRWVKLGFVQVKEKFLKGISELKNGEGGEYVLKVGRLNEELKVLREYESGGWKVKNGSR